MLFVCVPDLMVKVSPDLALSLYLGGMVTGGLFDSPGMAGVPGGRAVEFILDIADAIACTVIVILPKGASPTVYTPSAVIGPDPPRPSSPYT